MAATVSVSKGVFAFKRSSTDKSEQARKKRRSRSIKASPETPIHYWPDEEDTSAQRHRNFKACWGAYSEKLQKLETEIHQSVFRELVSFIGNSHAKNKVPIGLSTNNGSSKDCSSIPTAILVTGVNMPDSGEILASLDEQVKQHKAASHIVRLQSRNCTSIKHCIVSMVSQVLNSSSNDNNDQETESEDSDREDDELFTRKKSPKKSGPAGTKVKKANCTMQALDAWYQDQLSSGITGNIVVILEDFECFASPLLLQDFIQICSHHPRLPLVLVLCVATSPAAVHTSLTKPVMGRLAITTFQARPSHHYLTTLVEQVLMDVSVSSFRLGGRALKSLLDMFLYHHLSVNTFVQGLKYCVLSHFLGSPASLLCCPISDRQRRVEGLTEGRLEDIRKLPSFRQYVNSLPSKEKVPMFNDNKCKSVLLTLLSALDSHYSRLCVVVRSLHHLAAALPNAPLGRQVWSLLSLSLNTRVSESSEIQEVWTQIKDWSREDILTPLPSVITCLAVCGDPELHAVADTLQELLSKLLDMDEDQEEDEIEGNKPRDSPVKQLKPTDRFQLKQKLLELVAAKKRLNKPNKFQLIRTELITVLQELVANYLVPPTTLPLHEVLFYNDSSEAVNRLLGHHRAAITKALVDPAFYLQCRCCSDAAGAGGSLPDLSVVYRLHLECGRLINLYDWMQAFFSLAEEGRQEQAAVMQSRFVSAVSELQFLGFIKTSKTKTDHVSRLTWGNF